MNNSGINSKPVTYSDLLAIIKEVVQLRTRLTTRPSEQDIKDYKLLIKVFEAYARIREHQDILVDTISGVTIPETATTQIPTSSDTTSIVLEEKNLSKKSLVDQKPDQSENNIIYLFGNNQPTSPVTEVSDCDSDMDPNELFEDDYKIIPDKDDKDKDKDKDDRDDKDDKDVELMLKKSAFQLSRAISNKNYIVTEEEVTEEVIVDEVDTNKTINTDTIVTNSDTNVITTTDNFSENSTEQQQYGFKKPDVYYDSVCQKYNGGVDKYHDVFY